MKVSPDPRHDPDAPANLSYQLIPSGDPAHPLGVLLSWDVPRQRSRQFLQRVRPHVDARTRGSFARRRRRRRFTTPARPRRSTTSRRATRNGNEIAQSAIVTIDLLSRGCPRRRALRRSRSTAAIQLAWSSNAVDASHGTFDHYRVYSTDYDGSRGVCTADWVVEGSTVSDAFLAGNLTNGVSRCFAVSAVTRDGHESGGASRGWTRRAPMRATRSSTRRAARRDSSGFLFFDESTRKARRRRVRRRAPISISRSSVTPTGRCGSRRRAPP